MLSAIIALSKMENHPKHRKAVLTIGESGLLGECPTRLNHRAGSIAITTPLDKKIRTHMHTTSIFALEDMNVAERYDMAMTPTITARTIHCLALV